MTTLTVLDTGDPDPPPATRMSKKQCGRFVSATVFSGAILGGTTRRVLWVADCCGGWGEVDEGEVETVVTAGPREAAAAAAWSWEGRTDTVGQLILETSDQL